MVIAVNGINKTNIFERLFYGLKYKIQMVLAAFAAKADCTDKNTTVVSARAEYIINTYGNSIMRLAYSYLHNMSDAEDILQETLIKYVKTAPKFENDSHEKAWLMTVAANLSKNKIDYNRIRTTDELQDTLVAEEREDLSFVWEAVTTASVQIQRSNSSFLLRRLFNGRCGENSRQKRGHRTFRPEQGKKTA